VYSTTRRWNGPCPSASMHMHVFLSLQVFRKQRFIGVKLCENVSGLAGCVQNFIHNAQAGVADGRAWRPRSTLHRVPRKSCTASHTCTSFHGHVVRSVRTARAQGKGGPCGHSDVQGVVRLH
jgi:hypothetical protein